MAVRFAVAIIRDHRQVPAGTLGTLRQAGHDDAEMLEIMPHVALNTLTNYVNLVAGTEVDFTAAARRAA